MRLRHMAPKGIMLTRYRNLTYLAIEIDSVMITEIFLQSE